MAATKWVLEPSHSELQFKVRHLMISNITGSFKKFDATVETEGDDLSTANINFSADINSINTNNEQRDGHLVSADFFDAANHPQLTFTGNGMVKNGDEQYTLSGTLTLHGVAQPVTLNVEHGGVMTDPWGHTRTGFTVEGKINRKDFGLTWEALTETGGLVVSDEVKIHANVEFVKA